MRYRALAALGCVLLSILVSRAGQLPLTIKEISLMLRSGYSSNAVMQELSTRHFAEKLDAEKEKPLIQVGASAELITALKSGTYLLSPEQMTIAQRQIADQTKRRAAEAERDDPRDTEQGINKLRTDECTYSM